MTIIVIGGNSGIGYEITKNLRKEGQEVKTISRSKVENDKNHISCDITNYSALKNVYKDLNHKKIKISSLINCAGVASMNLALTTPPQTTEKLINTNLFGTIYSNQIFAPAIIKSGGGRIINFSTIAVSIGLKGESVYIATKAGVEAFSRTFANEVSTFNITVNCIAPGPIKTNLLKGISDSQIKAIINRQIIKKQMSPKNVFNIVKMLLSPEASEITGQVLHVGGF